MPTDFAAVSVPVASVALQPTQATLHAGAYLQAFATLAPADATDLRLVWSSDGAAATVTQQGLITAVAPGQCVITVVPWSGSSSAQLQLTVLAALGPFPVASVQISPSSLRLTLGGRAVRLRAAVLPPNAIDPNATWSSDDPSVATVDGSGIVRTVNAGRCTVTASAGGVASAPCTVQVFAKAWEPPPRHRLGRRGELLARPAE
jgi:uncharacterized protein YjdB